MNDMALRDKIMAIVIDSGVYRPPPLDDQQAFINNQLDIELDQLDIDSLSSMEICIGIELELGISITPTQLSRLKTLKSVERKIRAKIS